MTYAVFSHQPQQQGCINNHQPNSINIAPRSVKTPPELSYIDCTPPNAVRLIVKLKRLLIGHEPTVNYIEVWISKRRWCLISDGSAQ